jgi:isoleucyl-tRNA synthetase
VADVIDAWYDSGSMPFAQCYPWVEGSEERFGRAHPADFISEAIDQTRGWFYTLMAIGTVVFDESPYRNVVCLGHILAEDGRKMSKHLGNILEPLPLMDAHSADAVRWFMACSGSPWKSRGIGPNVLNEIVRKVLLTYWNTVAFHALYARLADWSPAARPRRSPSARCWTAGWSARRTAGPDADEAYDGYDTQKLGCWSGSSSTCCRTGTCAARVGGSGRRRGRPGDPARDPGRADPADGPAHPFVTERVWQDVFAGHARGGGVGPPGVVPGVRRGPDRGHAGHPREHGPAGGRAGPVGPRGGEGPHPQPLRRALVGSAAIAELEQALLDEIAEELNVGSVQPLASAGADLVEYSAKATFASSASGSPSGPGGRQGDRRRRPAGLAAALRAGGTATSRWTAHRSRCRPARCCCPSGRGEGWSVVNEQGETVAWTWRSPRNYVRRASPGAGADLQEARKNAGLEVSDRIRVWLAADDPDLAGALAKHEGLIAMRSWPPS